MQNTNINISLNNNNGTDPNDLVINGLISGKLDYINFLANLKVLVDNMADVKHRLDSQERVLRHMYQHLCERNFIPQLENPFPQYVPPPKPENNNDHPDH
jgi:hypothetical protein